MANLAADTFKALLAGVCPLDGFAPDHAAEAEWIPRPGALPLKSIELYTARVIGMSGSKMSCDLRCNSG